MTGVHEIGARVFAFIDTPNSILTQPDKQDYLILYPMNEQLKFYMTANYLMYKNGEFDEYDRYNKEMELTLQMHWFRLKRIRMNGLIEYAKNKVAFLKEHKDLPHYLSVPATSMAQLILMQCAIGKNRCGSAPIHQCCRNFPWNAGDYCG